MTLRRHVRWWLIVPIALAFMLVLLVVGFRPGQYLRKSLGIKKRPNILILSFCSLRAEKLPFYETSKQNLAPNIEHAFSQGAFVFDSSVNTYSWTNINDSVWPLIPTKFQREAGYFDLGEISFGRSMRIPTAKTYTSRSREHSLIQIRDQSYEKHFQKEFEFLADVLKEKMFSPFIGIAHVKYMHYPLIDKVNSDAKWDRYLTLEEKARLDEYFYHPAQYYVKLPLLLYLTGDVGFARSHPKIRAQYPHGNQIENLEVLGLLRDESLLQEWKDSKDFDLDLKIINKIYSANISYLDEKLSRLLRLLDDPELVSNTVLIFTGDHGESFMEHGYFTHAVSPYQESYQVPLMIRFPGQKGVTHITGQHSFLSVTQLIKEIMSGNVDERNFKVAEEQLEEKAIVQRDCAQRFRGLRYENKWTWYANVATGAESLFDIQADRAEIHDLVEKFPDVASDLKGKYWTNRSKYIYQDPGECGGQWLKEEGKGRRSRTGH